MNKNHNIIFAPMALIVCLISGCSVVGKQYEKLVSEGDYDSAFKLQNENTEYFSNKKKRAKHIESINTLVNHYQDSYRSKVTEEQSTLIQKSNVEKLSESEWKTAKQAISRSSKYFDKEPDHLRQFRESNPHLLAAISADYSVLSSPVHCKVLQQNARDAIQSYEILHDRYFFDVYPECLSPGAQRSSTVTKAQRAAILDNLLSGQTSPLIRANLAHLIEVERKYAADLSTDTKKVIGQKIFDRTLSNQHTERGQKTAAEVISSARFASKHGYDQREALAQINVHFLANDDFFKIHYSNNTSRVTETQPRQMNYRLSSNKAPDSVYVLPLAKKLSFGQKKPEFVSSKFKSGTEMVSNPKYATARQNVQEARQSVQKAEQAFRESQQQAKRRQQQLNSAAKSGSTSASRVFNLTLLNALVPTLSSNGVNSAKQRLRESEEKLSETPAQVSRDTFQNYQYETNMPEAKKSFELYIAVYNPGSDGFDLYYQRKEFARRFKVAIGRHKSDTTRRNFDEASSIQKWLEEPHVLNLDSVLPDVITDENFIDANVSAAELFELIKAGSPSTGIIN